MAIIPRATPATMVKIKLRQEHIIEAKSHEEEVRVRRTQASDYDSLTGNLGEVIFAEWHLGDFRNHNLGKTKGKLDFDHIEIKTSAFPFSEKLHLKVREDYYEKRHPPIYVQIIISVKNAGLMPAVDDIAYICGFCSHRYLHKHGICKEETNRHGEFIGYRCMNLRITELADMAYFRDALATITCR